VYASKKRREVDIMIILSVLYFIVYIVSDASSQEPEEAPTERYDSEDIAEIPGKITCTYSIKCFGYYIFSLYDFISHNNFF
jgi:hypothetical protein